MLIQNSVYRNTYVANGTTTTFAYTTPILDASWLTIYQQLPDAENDEQTIVNPSNYTLTGVGNPAAGNVVFNEAPANGTRLAIVLSVPITQLYKYTELDNFPAESHEDALAKLTLICQMLADESARSIKTTETSAETPEELLTSIYTARDTSVEYGQQATASAAAAAASETNAAMSADSAASDAATAQAWAESPVAPNPQDSSSKSAKTWADMAATSESDAYGSAQSATSSAQQAANSAQAAAQSASLAQSKAEEAAASELAALTSESNASTSESNAAMSESNAAESETNAAASATSAAESADTATQAALATEIPRNPGEIFYSLLPINDPRVHLLDGTVLEYDNPRYRAFIDHVADIYNDAPIVSNISPRGNLIDTDGVLSNFTAPATARIYHSFDTRDGSWELNLKFTTGNDVASEQYIISSLKTANGIKLSITNTSKFHFYAYASSTISVDGSHTVSANTTYYVKIAFTGDAYTLAISTDGISYFNDISFSSTAGITLGQKTTYLLGATTTTGANIYTLEKLFSGSIDLSQCSFIRNGEICWTGRGRSGFTTEGDWNASIAKYEACGKFVYNSVTKTVRLPKATGFIEGTISTQALGSMMDAGLPGHSHRAAHAQTASIKPGTSTATSLAKLLTSDTQYVTTSPYGDSNTVQPQAIQGFIYIVLANRLKFPTDIDIENIIDTAQAWAESSTPPDPDDPTSKSAKTWAQMASPYAGGIFTATVFEPTAALSGTEIDVSVASVFSKTITANTVFTFTGVPVGQAATFSLILTNGGAYTVTWPSSVKWAGGTPPTLVAIGVDVLTFLTGDGGTTWYGVASSTGAA